MSTLALLIGIGLAQTQAEVWKDSTGKFQVNARLVEVYRGVVELQKSDGTRLWVPFEKLHRDSLIRVLASMDLPKSPDVKQPQKATNTKKEHPLVTDVIADTFKRNNFPKGEMTAVRRERARSAFQ